MTIELASRGYLRHITRFQPLTCPSPPVIVAVDVVRPIMKSANVDEDVTVKHSIRAALEEESKTLKPTIQAAEPSYGAKPVITGASTLRPRIKKAKVEP